MTDKETQDWGRVDETGTVYVRTADGEREVGQFLDGTPEEALAFYQRKYDDLDAALRLLEQRLRTGAPAKDIAKTAAQLREQVTEAKAVGDLAALAARLDAIDAQVAEVDQRQQQERQAAIEAARAEREAIVAAAEALAAKDPAKQQWKQAAAEIDQLFQQWQHSQQHGPRLPKADSDALWQRFRAARSTLDAGRRAFFAELDQQQRKVRDAKRALIERAEALAPKGAAGIDEYRRLLDEWKRAGRSGRKQDDALWEKFKAAGDVLYSAKAERDAIENAEYAANLEQKLAVLQDAEAILSMTDLDQARDALRAIHDRWDAIGRVPREHLRSVEDRLRKVEAHVKALADEQWAKNNPAAQSRGGGLAVQLQEAIAKLEAELEAAKESKDADRIRAAEEALAARKVWLDALS